MAENGSYYRIYGVNNLGFKNKQGQRVLCATVFWEPLLYEYDRNDRSIIRYCGEPNQVFNEPEMTSRCKITSEISLLDPDVVGRNHHDRCFAWINDTSCNCPFYSRDDWKNVARAPEAEELVAFSTTDENFVYGISKHLYETVRVEENGEMVEKRVLKFLKEWYPEVIRFSQLPRSLQLKLKAGFTFSCEKKLDIFDTCVEYFPDTKTSREMPASEFNQELTAYLRRNNLL